jgi:hypothetical protein
MTTVDMVAMPVAEKLKLMETLWDSLCIQSAAGVASPRGMAKCLRIAYAVSPAGKRP